MDIEFPVCVLKASYQPRFGKLTHRDVLGAFMHQGIERAQLGDFLIEERDIYVMAMEPISAYLIDQVTMIRHSGLRFSPLCGSARYQSAYAAARMQCVFAAVRCARQRALSCFPSRAAALSRAEW